jgi:fibronectin-binding autotransporter adhesin
VDTLREPLTIAGAGIGGASGAIRIGSGATIATNIVLSAPATINTIGGGNLLIDGTISGTGPLTKIGPGTLDAWVASRANTFSGDLLAKNGLLLLSKLAGSAVQGDLVIGTTNTSATARHTRSANLGGAVTMHGR